MKLEIDIPENVNVELNKNVISVSGPKGKVIKDFKSKVVTVTLENNKVVLSINTDRRKEYAQIKTLEKIVKNLFNGVLYNYKYTLKVIYSHFPVTVALKGKELHVNNFAGGKKPFIFNVPENVDLQVKGRDIVIKSVDKEKAGIFAGLIEQKVKVKNKDRRIFQDGIYIVEKGVLDEQ